MCFEHFVKLVWGTAGNGSVKQTFKCVANICSAVTRVSVFFCNFNCCPFLTDQCKSMRQLSAIKIPMGICFSLTADANIVIKVFLRHRAEDQVEIKMPPAYADIFTSGTGRCIRFSYCLNWNNRDHFSGAAENLGSPPAYYSNTPSPQEPAAPPPQVKH